ncbi:MAG: hypothetical protein FJ144_11335 [Deltaproteobacteria bacterium]|nr:hypothetical protein [Deltaproteobacteria bacterium]
MALDPRTLLPRLALLLAAVLLAAAPEARAADEPDASDAFLCTRAQDPDGSDGRQLAVRDELGSGPVRVLAPSRLCEAVTLDGTPPREEPTHLLGHVARVRDGKWRRRGTPIENVLQESAVNSSAPDLLLLPTAIGEAPPPAPPAADAYRCYRAIDAGSGSLAGATAEVTDATGASKRLRLGRVRRLCAAASVEGAALEHPSWHLACYDARPAPGETRAERGTATATTALGTRTLETRSERELCVASRILPGCNGSLALCDRRFDEVAYATTHNAMANQEDGFLFPNQRFAVPRQLDDGIRSLMLDTHYRQGVVTLCHSLCGIGNRPLLDTLVEIRTFFEQRPYEVVSIIFESYVSAADTRAVFEAAGLLPYLHVQPLGTPWPTLREMLESGRRLVVFTDAGGGGFPGYHHVWSYAYETPFSFESPEDLVCTPNRGDPDNSLFILNHFLTRITGNVELARMINRNPLFLSRALQCMGENGSLPNFVTVDFYDIGHTLDVVRALNED